MKKEVFLAISIGFVLGLIITFGIWTANKSLKTMPQSPISPTVASPTQTVTQTTPTPASGITLQLTSPDEELLSNTANVTVSGKTTPNAIVMVLYETGSTSLSANSTGDFTVSIPLEGGYNMLTVTAVDETGNQTSATRTVTYTTQKI